MNAHIFPLAFYCSKCGACFSSEENLANHIEKHIQHNELLYKTTLTGKERRRILYALTLAIATARRTGEVDRIPIYEECHEILKHIIPVEDEA